LQQAANGHVQRHVGDIWVVSLVNFAVGTVGMLLVTWVFVVARGVELGSWPGNPMLYVGGLCGVFFVAVAAATVRLLGVLRLTLAVVAGQLTGGLLLDVVAPSAGRPGIQLVAGVAVVFAAVAVAARPDKRAGTPPARP
jgi:transporter family-2 protein